MANRNPEIIGAFARIYAFVEYCCVQNKRALKLGDTCAISDAMRNPLRGMTAALYAANTAHILSDLDNEYIASISAKITDTEGLESPNACLSLEDQGVWSLAYYQEKARLNEERKNLVPIYKYAQDHDIETATMRTRCMRGMYKSARKIGNSWYVNPDDEARDRRRAD